MQKLLLISGDSAPFYRLVAEALCDRFDKMLLIEVSDFKKFIYSGLQPDNQTEKITTQQHNIGIEGATATAAAALEARYGVIILDHVSNKSALAHYEHLITKHGIEEVNVVSLRMAENNADGDTPELFGKVISYEREDQYLEIADLIQDLIGKGEIFISVAE